MARRLILGGVVAIAALLTAPSVTAPAWAQAQGAWTCPAAENAKKNTVAKSDAASAAGKKLTVDKACTACHGDGGKGTAPAPRLSTRSRRTGPRRRCSSRATDASSGRSRPAAERCRPGPLSPRPSAGQLIHYIRTLKK